METMTPEEIMATLDGLNSLSHGDVKVAMAEAKKMIADEQLDAAMEIVGKMTALDLGTCIVRLCRKAWG